MKVLCFLILIYKIISQVFQIYYCICYEVEFKKKDLLLLLVNKYLFFEFIMYLENNDIIENKVEKKVIID